jgi:hypothetical protein
MVFTPFLGCKKKWGKNPSRERTQEFSPGDAWNKGLKNLILYT